MPGYESPPGSHGDFVLRVLGGFALFWEDSVLRVPRASQRLLAFLALQRRMVKRAAIAGTLWPEASERHASANLRSALARLQGTARKALAANKLELGLAEGIVVDVRDAQGLARRLLDPAATPDRAELGLAAVPVLSADLLPDWYDDWVLLDAEDWRQLRLQSEAVREFTRYRTLLDAELGLAPTPRLHELLASLHSPSRCDHCHGVTIGI